MISAVLPLLLAAAEPSPEGPALAPDVREVYDLALEFESIAETALAQRDVERQKAARMRALISEMIQDLDAEREIIDATRVALTQERDLRLESMDRLERLEGRLGWAPWVIGGAAVASFVGGLLVGVMAAR